MYISKKNSKKNICGVVYFVKVVRLHTTDYLMWNTKVSFTALKYKKALVAILKENLRFKQLQLNYINSQKK